MIYFSAYEEENKKVSTGYMAVFLRGESCEVQLYYRARTEEDGGKIQPVYVFLDGTVALGSEIFVEEGMAITSFRTVRRDFIQSGHSFEELETVYLDGVKCRLCGGRIDGKELKLLTAPGASYLEQKAAKQKEIPANRCPLPGGSRYRCRIPGFRNP